MDLVVRAERCFGPVSDRAARGALLDLIRSRVRFDAHLFALTDPTTGVISSPHADVPASLPLGELIRRRYAGAEPAFRAWLRDHGVADVIAVDLVDAYGRWGLLELWSTSAPFGAGDREVLGRLAAPVTGGVRRTLAATFAAPTAASPPSAAEPNPAEPTPAEVGVVVLDDDLRVLDRTDAAARALLTLLPADAPAPPVPAAAYNVAAALLAQERGLPWRPSSRVHLDGSRWLAMSGERLGDRIAVTLTPLAGTDRVDLFARCHGLSPREREVLDLVLAGLDGRAIAAALVIAPTTADDHLRALLAKTGSPSRQVMIVRALGEPGR